MTINGNGIANATGKQLLQIIPINVVTIVAVIAAAVGLYYKFDARLAGLEKANAAGRVEYLEKRMDENTQRTIRIDTNVMWLMDKKGKTVGPPEE